MLTVFLSGLVAVGQPDTEAFSFFQARVKMSVFTQTP